MQKRCKKLLICFAFLAVFLGSFLCVVVWVADPFRLWHESFVCKNEFYDDMRYNAKWLIDRSYFDSIVLGSSMLANTSSKEASALLGGEFINLSIWGSDFDERAMVLKYALNKKPLKKVIMNLDLGLFLPFKTGEKNNSYNSYDFLYDDNSLNDWQIYKNIKHLRKILSFSCEENINTDMPSAWTGLKEHMRRFGGVKNWDDGKINAKILTVLAPAVQSKKLLTAQAKEPDYNSLTWHEQNIEKNILSFAKEFKQTEFILLIPPYFIGQNAIFAQTSTQTFILQKAIIKYILEQNLQNVKIYAFGNESFSQNIENYMDLIHYSPQINSLLLRRVASKENILNMQNFNSYWNEFEKISKNFDMMAFYELLFTLKKDENVQKK